MIETLPKADCPFCLTDGHTEPIIAHTPHSYVLEPNNSPGNYLIIPRLHIESPLDLPDNWWQEVKTILPQLPDVAPSYNIALNIGRTAGQSVKHLHFWIVSRTEGNNDSGKGLTRLINEINGTA